MHRAAVILACAAVAVGCAVLLAVDQHPVRPRWPR